jgi:hypothetical protein
MRLHMHTRACALDVCRLADGRKLEAGDVMQLVEGCINEPWHGGTSPVNKALLLIAPLKPGLHISGDNLLQLMQDCAQEQ